METSIFSSTEIDQASWDSLVDTSKQGQVYHLFDYINTLCAGEWQSVVVHDQNQYVAVFPFFVKKKMGLSYFIHPPFCQYWGIVMRNEKEGNQKYYDEAKKIMKLILDVLPKSFKYIHAYFSPYADYMLPLVWDGWKLTPRYTYQVDIDRGLDDILASFASHTRREIKKAEKNGIHIQKEKGGDKAMEIFRAEKPHLVNAKNDGYLENLNKVVHKLGEERAFSICALQGEEVVAGIVYFKYKETLIYFFGTVKATYKNSGAMTAIIWESIKMHHSTCKILDFDGSMIEDIERYFRGFDAEPVVYMKAVKSSLPQWLSL